MPLHLPFLLLKCPIGFGTLGTANILPGQLLVINGETGHAEIYAIDPNTGDIVGMLSTEFGVSHVVGGAYHPIRNTFFLVQDKVPGNAEENTVAEIDPITGAVLNSVQITDTFIVNFGDLDISNTTGNLFIVSSDNTTIAEFTPEVTFVQSLDLPVGVSSLNGLSLHCENGTAWASGGSSLYSLSGFECGFLNVEDSQKIKPYIFPSPTTGNFTINLGKEYADVNVQIITMLGQIITSEKYVSAKIIVKQLDAPSGIYFIKVSPVNEGTKTLRIIRN